MNVRMLAALDEEDAWSVFTPWLCTFVYLAVWPKSKFHFPFLVIHKNEHLPNGRKLSQSKFKIWPNTFAFVKLQNDGDSAWSPEADFIWKPNLFDHWTDMKLYLILLKKSNKVALSLVYFM